MTKRQNEQAVWSTKEKSFFGNAKGEAVFKTEREKEDSIVRENPEELECMIIQYLKQSPMWHRQYQTLDEEWQRRFMDFCVGKRTLPLTYDPFFKRIFHPDVHPERLSRMLSSILGKQVKVVSILPEEDTLLDGGALVIMDILVELADGSLANVEVQKIPYLFPAERMSCYSADLLLRQYSRVKGERGKNFKYDDIKKVYTVIFFEKSISIFHETEQAYIHRGRTVFDTNLKLELLQEYCLIALDVFREIPYPKIKDERNGWISLLATENVEDAKLLQQDYPWLVEIYREMESYMHRPEEALDMFSEALKILDRNTVQFMIDEQQEELERQRRELEEQRRQLEEQERQLKEKDAELKEKDEELKEKDEELKEKEKEIAYYKQLESGRK